MEPLKQIYINKIEEAILHLGHAQSTAIVLYRPLPERQRILKVIDEIENILSQAQDE